MIKLISMEQGEFDTFFEKISFDMQKKMSLIDNGRQRMRLKDYELNFRVSARWIGFEGSVHLEHFRGRTKNKTQHFVGRSENGRT